jgi:hypothetical protein
VLDLLGMLVDKSLVVAEGGDAADAPRYRLLESGRAMALEKLHEAGESDAMLRRHARTILAAFEKGDEQRWSLTRRAQREMWMPSIPNLRAAVSWAARNDGELLIALAGAAEWVWPEVHLRPEGQAWCEQAISRLVDTTPPALEARLQLALATIAYPRVTPADMRAVQRAVDLYRQLGDRRGLYVGLATLAQRKAMHRKGPEAWQAIDDATGLLDPSWPPALHWLLMRARSFAHRYVGLTGDIAQDERQSGALWELVARQQAMVGDDLGQLMSLMNAGEGALSYDFDAAVKLLREVIALAPSMGDRSSLTWGMARANLSGALAQQGQHLDEALQLAREAVPVLSRDNLLADFMDHFGLLAFKLERAADAALALGFADAHWLACGTAREAHESRSCEALATALAQALPCEQIEKLKKEGASLSAEEAARIALAVR